MFLLNILGFIYLIKLINENLYKIFPLININKFFIRKLGIKEVHSLKEYIEAKIKINKGLKNIKVLIKEDLSEFDLKAFEELSEFIKYEFNNYIKTLNQKITSSYIQYTLNCGILDFSLSQNDSFVDDINIKFQSFSEDSPLLEITTKEAFCTYKYKSKYIRFINPDIDIINSIKETLKTIKYAYLCL